MVLGSGILKSTSFSTNWNKIPKHHVSWTKLLLL